MVQSAPRSAKTKALGEKIWLPTKCPAGESKEPAVQKKIKTSKKRIADAIDVDERENAREKAKSAPGPARQKPARRRAPSVDSNNSSSLTEASSDDDVAGEDNDSHLKSMTDEQLVGIVGGKNTVIIKTRASKRVSDPSSTTVPLLLFDLPDKDVEIVRSRAPSRAASRGSRAPSPEFQSRAPSRASSRASGPPTSDDEDHFKEPEEASDRDHNGSDNETQAKDDSEDSLVVVPKQSSRQRRADSRKKPTKHEEKFEREQPIIKVATAEQRAKTVSTKNNADDDSKWPLWTHIVYSSKGKAKLLMQHQVIPWPELETVQEVYRCQILNRGAKVVERDDIRAQEVRERVKGSIKYSAVLGDLVVDRLSIIRSPARTSALSHIACFELGVDEVCQQRVAAVVENDLYIYPGTWQIQEVEKKNEKTGKIVKQRMSIWAISDHSLIYQNKGFMDTLKDTFFDTKGGFGFKYLDQFKSTLEGREEPELTIPIVALGATGFHAALHSWSSGSFHKKEKFEGKIFNTVFERHIKYLEQIKEDNHIAFHIIMSRLYTHVTKGSVNTGQQNGTSNALSVVDLSGYE